MAIIPGTNGNDFLIGTAGDDIINGTILIPFSLPGTAGHDTVFAHAGNDRVFGGTGNDTLFGGAGNDTLYGESGNDRLNGGTGNDRLEGGSGVDTADYSNGSINGQNYIGATTGVSVNLNLGTQTTIGSGDDTLVSIENLIGTNFIDTFIGNGGANVLDGRDGNDTLSGRGGDDRLFGGNGQDTLNGEGGADQLYGGNGDDTLNGGDNNDRLNGGLGNDRLNGGGGSDTADYSNGTIQSGSISYGFTGAIGGVTVNLGLTGAQNTGGGGTDTLVSIENLTGTNAGDILTGNNADNVLKGLNGHDQLNGGAGNDTLDGGNNNDVLTGGSGRDQLTGGAGVDRFDYNAVSDSPAGGRDIITDFNTDFDTIDLRDIDANPFVAGDQAFSMIAAELSFSSPGQLRYNRASGLLQGNTDTDTAAEFEIQLTGSPELNLGGISTDIIL